MKSRDVVGRKIVRIEQGPCYDTRGDLIDYALGAIVLDNGWEICFTVAELADDYAVIPQVFKPQKKGGSR